MAIDIKSVINFKNIDYLQVGNKKQKLAYTALTKNSILDSLREFDPILVGTIPINIDVDKSDLDIICCFKDKINFEQHVIEKFKHTTGFKLVSDSTLASPSVVANFRIADFEIEIFGQAIPTKLQNAYRHMLIENDLINKYGEDFRQRIIQLKKKGYKTEPAFALELGLQGDPYVALLEYGQEG